MLSTYDRLMRQYRLEAQLSYRESDRRNPQEVLTWTRDRQKERQAVKDSVRSMEGM